jgi:murein DD-endopeptidase MepM/ murein hydrolase activator NlpD
MRALPWILGGGAALAAYYWPRREHDASTPGGEPLSGRWVWPVGVWLGRKPEISDGFASKRRSPSGQIIPHCGVDIMYRRLPGDPWRAGTPNGSTHFVLPERRAALAASDGVIWSASQTPRGGSVVIDHSPRKLATYYTHLSSLRVAKGQQVSAGEPLGIIGGDPLDAAHLMHLHFEAWRGGRADAFDPQPFMTSWEYLRDPAEPSGAVVARNGGQRSGDRAPYSVPVHRHFRRLPRR